MKNDGEKEYLNIAKGIGIILIVVGHSFVEESDSLLRNCLYMFHVPLFLMVSGYFFKDRYTEVPLQLIGRRIRSLWWPFFYWSFLFIFLHYLLFSLQNKGYFLLGINTVQYIDFGIVVQKVGKLFLFKGMEKLLGAFWFLPCLFFSVLFFLFYNLLSKKMGRAYFLPLFCFCGFLVGNVLIAFNIYVPLIPYDLRFYAITTFLYSMGYFYRMVEDRVVFDWRVAVLFLVVLFGLGYFHGFKIANINSVVGDILATPLYLLITPICGTYIVLYVAKKLESSALSPVFNSLGKKTITILALHFACFIPVNYFIVKYHDLDPVFITAFPVISGYENLFILYVGAGLFLPVIINQGVRRVMKTLDYAFLKYRSN